MKWRLVELIEEWTYARVSMTASIAAGIAYILFAMMAGAPPQPGRDVAIFAGLQLVCLIAANGLLLWRDVTVSRAERRASELRRHQL